MRFLALAGLMLVLSAAMFPVRAADDLGLTRMAMCADSWTEWQKSAPARLDKFGEDIRAKFVPHGNDAYILPKTNLSVAGFRVLEVYPESVGMGVGFSLTVDAGFERARKAMEKAFGRPLEHCETGDGMRNCELEIGPQRTFTLMAEDDPKSHRTLIGCYYFYEK